MIHYKCSCKRSDAVTFANAMLREYLTPRGDPTAYRFEVRVKSPNDRDCLVVMYIFDLENDPSTNCDAVTPTPYEYPDFTEYPFVISWETALQAVESVWSTASPGWGTAPPLRRAVTTADLVADMARQFTDAETPEVATNVADRPDEVANQPRRMPGEYRVEWTGYPVQNPRAFARIDQQ